ncbi:hypothetical protein Bca101_087820 [Brassica carinata]
MAHPTQTETRLDSPAMCRNHSDTKDTCRSLPSPSPLGTTRRTFTGTDTSEPRSMKPHRFQPNSIIFLA